MSGVGVKKISINASGELRIEPFLPEGQDFRFIYRSSSGVHWDDAAKCLYCPTPRKWSYSRWFAHAVAAVAGEYGCQLTLSDSTDWSNVPKEVRAQIEADNAGSRQSGRSP